MNTCDTFSNHCNMDTIIYSLICLLVFTVVGTNGQYEDVRCKCVCGSIKLPNQTNPSRRVFVQSFNDHELCQCENVVTKELQEADFKYCDRCECQWQRRNTATIKVVVILIICVISLLFLYMLFLLCLDPLMTRRPKSYIEQHNEEVNLDTQSIHRGASSATGGGDARQRPTALMSRVKHEVSKVRGEQQRWKGQVQEQRRHIYDRHTMLN